MSSSTDVEMSPPGEGGGVEGAESSTTGQADTTTGEADTDTGQAGRADTTTGEDVPMEVDSDVTKAELGLGLGLASGGDKDDRESDANWDVAGKSVVVPSTSASNYQPTRKKPSPPPSFWTTWTSYIKKLYSPREGHGTQNAEFYQNERRCQPDDMLIDEIHKEWWGDYRLLEYRHGYIQWLFPIREQGLNQREIEIISGDKKALSRILTSYKMMLDFYGMELIPDTEGDVRRGRNWGRGFDNLNHSMHNYLRITRILKCLGEFDYERLKAPFIRFVLREAIVERTLSRTLDSCKNYWIQVLRSDKERNDMTEYIKELKQELKQEQKEKREIQKRISDEKIERERQLRHKNSRERERKKEENDKKKKAKEENDKKKKEKELNDKKKNEKEKEKELNDKKQPKIKQLNAQKPNTSKEKLNGEGQGTTNAEFYQNETRCQPDRKDGVTRVKSRPAVPLTQDMADALQKLLKGSQVSIGHPIVAGTTTLEEVQQLLTQRGLEDMATNLRTRLRQILAVQQRNLEILDSVMKSTNFITLCCLKLFLVGPPFVGKTTTLNRLLKYFKNIRLEPEKAKLRSTLLANCLQVFALVSKDGTEWLSSKDLNEEAALLFGYFCGSDLESVGSSNYEFVESGGSNSEIRMRYESTTPPSPIAEKIIETREVGDDTTDKRLARVRDCISRLQNVIKDKDQSKELLKHIEGSTLLNINDIGGQPGFLEMLPALSNGPAMYLVFTDLSKELNKPYKIPFSRDDTTITPYDAMHSVESTVSQILSSIASIHRTSQEPVPFKLDRSTAFGQHFERLQEVRPMATLIGTHKDKLEEPVDQKISEFDSALTKVASNYKNIIVNPSPNRTIFAVDNFSGSDEMDVAPIRGFLSDIFKKQFKDSSISIQPNWLWFSLILRREYYIAPMDDCLVIARYLGIKEDELQLCLWYLHYCTGTIMYYPNIPGKYFKGHVICTPQVVFDSISEFIVASMRILHGDGPVIESERVELIKKGQFSIKSIEKYCKCPQVKEKLEERKLLPAKQLIKLLEYVHLLSPIVRSDTQSDKEEITYLMPAVLKFDSQEELANPPPPDTNNPEPLYITFSFGYVPTGVFCGLITRLVSQGPHRILGFKWKLVEKDVKRNCVSFDVDCVHKVTLLSHEKSYEIRVSRGDPESSLHDLCAHALSVVLYFLTSYEKLVPLIAFQCPCSNHKAERDATDLCTISDGSKVRFLCKDSLKLVKLKPEQRIWLGKTKKVGEEAKLEVLKFAEDGFSFHWTKEGSRRQIKTTDDQPNTVSFPSVREENFGHYQCEVKDAATGKVCLTLYKALYKEELSLCPPVSAYLQSPIFTAASAEMNKELTSNGTKSIVKTPSSDEGSLSSERLQYSAAPVQRVGTTTFSSIGPPSNRVTLQKLMRRYNLTDEQLNREIGNSDFPSLAIYFDDVDIHSNAMGLAPAEQADVKRVYHSEGIQAAMMKCLKIWKQRNSSRATYRALLDIVLRLGKEETADKICQQLTQRSSANRVILQELMRRYNLTDEQLNREIGNPDFPYLAIYFDDVDIYSNAMRLAPAEQADVNRVYHSEGTQAAMMKCLKIWKQRNSSRATYRALLDILLRLEKEETADKICQQLTQQTTPTILV